MSRFDYSSRLSAFLDLLKDAVTLNNNNISSAIMSRQISTFMVHVWIESSSHPDGGRCNKMFRLVLRLFLWGGGGCLIDPETRSDMVLCKTVYHNTGDPCPDRVNGTSIWVLSVTVTENISVGVRCQATEQREGHLTSYKLNSFVDQGWTNLETVIRSQESADLAPDWDYFEDY